MYFTALPTPEVRTLQSGGLDANGHPPEQTISDGGGNPCRHCLKDIPAGQKMLVLGHRPFSAPQPYAEIGPLFLCATECASGSAPDLPEILQTSPEYLVKAYDANERIIYGTGAIVAAAELENYAAKLLRTPTVSFVHVRSARNNCYQLRIDRR